MPLSACIEHSAESSGMEQVGDSREKFSAQGKVIIALLIVLILAVGALVFSTFMENRKNEESPVETASSSSTSSEEEPTEEVNSQDIDLASVDVDSVHAAPVPSAPDSWGEYTINQTWKGQVRVFEHAEEPSELLGQGGENWISSANGCGSLMYLVTFKAVNDQAKIQAELTDYNGDVIDGETSRSGWMLFTNCATPEMALGSINGIGNLSDVAYEVHEYVQASTDLGSSSVNVEPTIETDVAPESQEIPDVDLQCPGPGLTVFVPSTTPLSEMEWACEQARQSANQGESWCGGLYAPPEVPREEFLAKCNREPQYP